MLKVNMFSLKIVSLLTFFIFNIHSSDRINNAILTVDTLDPLFEQMPRLDKNSLIIFDRDDTLLQGIECMGAELRNNFVRLWKEIYSIKNEAQAQDLLRKIQSHTATLVDCRVLSLINELKDKDAKVIILTRGCHGKSNFGFLVEDMCIETFKKVGIDLSSSFSEYSGTTLEALNKNADCPLFKNGILFSNTCDKGLALQALLKKLKWSPTYIIFVDDKKQYVQEVQRIAKKLNIQFLGLHYTGACKLANPDLVQQCYRMCYLLERELF